MTFPTNPIQWTDEQYASFGLAPQVTPHRYHESPMFDKPGLVALMDAHPRRRLQAFTMGEDPTRRQDWACVDIPDDMDGETILKCVENGRLWVNITHIDTVNETFAELIKDMYEHLGAKCPHLQNPKSAYSTLLISSPNAQVYFHVDAEPNMLWHLRGQKRVWLYPAMDERYTPQNFLEDIYAGEVDEDLPYDPAFDAAADEHLLSPGDVASWPHNAPHRIENLDMNVSLATSYYTPAIYRRQYTQLANRFLMRGMGFKNRSMQEDGMTPAIKRTVFRVTNKIRPFPRRNRSANYITDLQLHQDAPLGYKQLDEKIPASFSESRHAA